MRAVPARPAITSIQLSLACLLAATIACGHDSTSTGPSPTSLDRVVVAADSTKITPNGALPVRVTLVALNGTEIKTGVEVYSLMRESSLDTDAFLDRYYDDGSERTQRWDGNG